MPSPSEVRRARHLFGQVRTPQKSFVFLAKIKNANKTFLWCGEVTASGGEAGQSFRSKMGSCSLELSKSY
jgi:hypothetical protein